MTDLDMAERAERERESYNKGLKRDTYDRYLNPAKVWFLEARKAHAKAVFESYPECRALELGSFTWVGWVENNGVRVPDLACINISEVELANGQDAAKTASNAPDFKIMDAQALQFEDDSFDVIFGSAILHHLEFETSLKEIHRTLRSDGSMIFAEPMDLNPVGILIRSLTPEARTDDERPFRMQELRLIEKYFDVTYHFEGLFSVPFGVFSTLLKMPSKNPITKAGYAIDRLIAKVPGLRLMCRHVFMVGKPRRI